MKKRLNLLSILLNPYVIAFIITIGIILFLPNYFNKYLLVEDFDKNFSTENNLFFYEDLNGDGISERIILFDNILYRNKAAYHIYMANGDVVDQFNLRTHYTHNKLAWFQDANHNGIKEIYILAKSNDSVFLHIQEHIHWKKPIEKTIFVDKLTGHNGFYDFGTGRNLTVFGANYDKDYVHFVVSSGYGGNPRKVYRYNPKNDEILKSPHFTNSGGISNMVDIDNDGKKEMLLTLYATANEIDSFDQWLGHPAGTTYHYHIEPTYLTTNFGKDAFIGFLADGFPVYGPQENGVTITSSDLDAYHGHTHATADFPEGIYHYHITADDPYLNGNGFFGIPGNISR